VPEEAPDSTSTEAGATGDQTTPPVTTGVEKTPEWYEREITKVRNEAASYRTRLRDTEAKFSGAKTQEDIDAAVADLKTANSKLERDLLVATVGAGLPPELRELLKGDTEAELTAHAAVLAKFNTPAQGQPTPPAQLQGGLDPSTGDDGFDPDKFADEWRTGVIPRASISGRRQ
jgi:hypothetical protein